WSIWVYVAVIAGRQPTRSRRTMRTARPAWLDSKREHTRPMLQKNYREAGRVLARTDPTLAPGELLPKKKNPILKPAWSRSGRLGLRLQPDEESGVELIKKD